MRKHTPDEVTCDTCGKDLNCTSYERESRILVTDENVPRCGGATFAMGLPPQLGREYHFCKPACLRASDLVKEPA